MTRKDVKGDQPSGGETTWTNTGATRYGRGQHKTGSFGDDMLRPSPNHGTQRLPNDDDDESRKKQQDTFSHKSVDICKVKNIIHRPNIYSLVTLFVYTI